MAPADPWTWHVDDVCLHLCKSRDLWTDRPQSSLPPPGMLEDILRTNEVDGPTLLQDVNSEVLKNDFGIPSLGQRSALLHAINKLRAISVRYGSNKAAIVHLESEIQKQAVALNPAPHIESHLPPVVDGGLPSAGSAIKRPNGTAQTKTEGAPSKKRRLDITSMTTAITIDDNPAKAKKPQNPDAYLKREAIPFDNVFLVNGHGAEENYNFQQLKPIPQGHMSFLNRRLRQLFTTAPLQIDENWTTLYLPPGKNVANRRKRPDTIHTRQKARSALVFSIDDEGHAIVAKRDAFNLHIKLPDQDAEVDDHQWDYLLDKWPNTNDDTSDKESEISTSTLEAEIEADKGEDERTTRQGLSEAEIVATIAAIRKEYVDSWKARKLPLKEAKAYKLWKSAQGHRQQALVVQCNDRLYKLEQRLQKLEQEYKSQVWTSRKKLQVACGNIEISVYEKEDCLWLLELWKRPTAPAKVISTPVIRTPKTKKYEDDEDSLSVGSDDSLLDFVDDDAISSSPSFSPSLRRSPQLQTKSRGGSPPSRRATMPNEKIAPIDGHASVPMKDVEKRSSENTPTASIIASTDSVFPLNPTMPEKTQTTSFGEVEVVDLTVSSPVTEAHCEVAITSTEQHDDDSESDEQPTNNPGNATRKDIISYKLDRLVLRHDRKRLIQRLLFNLESVEYQIVREQSQSRLKAENLEIIREGIIQLKSDTGKRLAEVIKPALIMARLFLCWEGSTYLHLNPSYEPPSWETYKDVLNEAILSNNSMSAFCDWIKETTGITGPFAMADSDEEARLANEISPLKVRKKQVLKSATGLGLRESAHTRRVELSQREERVQQKLALAGPMSDVYVNLSKLDDQDFIAIPNHIASQLKDHQIAGIRFMWREVVTGGMTTPQGCLLAHSMGLGKTLQAIAFIATLAEAATSANPRITSQIPKEFFHKTSGSQGEQTGLRVLILCPPGLIDNWLDELAKWNIRFSKLGDIFAVSPKHDLGLRLAIISTWYEKGGILLIGYDGFRSLLAEIPRKTEFTPEQREDLRRNLFAGPDVVIADEAHRLKNQASSISLLAAQFTTKSRIALTGSPLANNLFDYYAMIEWISPGYLGEPAEFKAHYQEPIEAGLFIESSRYQQRQSVKKLEALKADIDPKVSRADISVLHGQIPPKLEFVITVPLTDRQFQAYGLFVRDVTRGFNGISNTALFAWMAALGLLCTHPFAFLAKLDERASTQATKEKNNNKKKKKKKEEQPGRPKKIPDSVKAMQDIPECEGGDDESRTFVLDLQESFINEERAIYTGQKAEDPALSNKTMIIQEILKGAQEAGDKVLIFSQRILTLDHLETMLSSMSPRVRFSRLDGKTKIADRQEMAKKFNTSEIDVFLISTLAGGLGLNIPGANRVIVVDFNFNPSHEEQAVGRSYRIGQRKPVFVYHLIVGGTFEEAIHQRTTFKRQLAARVVDKKRPESAAMKMKDFFFEPKVVEQQDNIDEHRGKDSVLDKVLDSEAGQYIRGLTTTEILFAEAQAMQPTEEEQKEVNEDIKDRQLQRTNLMAWRARNIGRNAGMKNRTELDPGLETQRYNEQMRLLGPDRNKISNVMPAFTRLPPKVSYTTQQSGTAPQRDLYSFPGSATFSKASSTKEAAQSLPTTPALPPDQIRPYSAPVGQFLEPSSASVALPQSFAPAQPSPSARSFPGPWLSSEGENFRTQHSFANLLLSTERISDRLAPQKSPEQILGAYCNCPTAQEFLRRGGMTNKDVQDLATVLERYPATRNDIDSAMDMWKNEVSCRGPS